mgnify:CR=1 FL=1
MRSSAKVDHKARNVGVHEVSFLAYETPEYPNVTAKCHFGLAVQIEYLRLQRVLVHHSNVNSTQQAWAMHPEQLPTHRVKMALGVPPCRPTPPRRGGGVPPPPTPPKAPSPRIDSARHNAKSNHVYAPLSMFTCKYPHAVILMIPTVATKAAQYPWSLCCLITSQSARCDQNRVTLWHTKNCGVACS